MVTAAGLTPTGSFAADIRGRITILSSSDPAHTAGSVLIEGVPEKGMGVDKAATRITPKTRVFKLQDGKKAAKKFSDLKVGQLVEATFSGPVAESYPVQATAGVIIIITGAGNLAPDHEPALKKGAEVSLRGRLTGGMMAIGGESTGWVLSYATKAGRRQIEVDFSSLDTGNKLEGPVRITGKIFQKHYTERGPVLILRATKVEVSSEE